MVERVEEVEEKIAWYRSVGGRVWKLFSSVRLTIFVLITIAVVSIIGTLIEQGRPMDYYRMAYGEGWAAIISRFGLDDMYHTLWFTALLGLLVLNIVVCTLERFPAKWRVLLREKSNEDFDTSIIDRLGCKERVVVDGRLDEVREYIVGLLRKRRYKVRLKQGDDGFGVYAWKGIVSRFGSDVTHLSLLLILLGAIIGSIWGYRDFTPILEGATVKVPGANFSLRLERFWIDYYDTGQIKQYNSLLTVIEDGREVLTKHIWVNEPLYYKGIRFYQSSYGIAWDRIREAEVGLQNIEEQRIEKVVRAKWGEPMQIEGTEYTIKVVGYVSDFAFDERTRTVFSKSAETKNPAVQVEVYKDGKLVARPWLFFNYPGIIKTMPDKRYDLVLTGFRTIPYSGISMNKDPGTNIVWAGSAIMGVGFVLAFFVYHRRLWVDVKMCSDRADVKVGGVSNKNPFAFEREFKEITEGIRRISGKNKEA